MKTILITGGFCLLALVYAMLFGIPNGSPWYMFPLGFLIMIPFVGIAEETGWRGLLQPELEKRMQPLYFLITTAGTDTKSICYETHQKAKDIIEGRKIDPTFYPVIYGADESDDWTDPKVWKKANPSLGVTVGIDKVKAACESAKQNPGEENAFRQLRLNQWVKQAVRWMPMDKWDKCAFVADPTQLEGRVCYGGLDLSSSTDITAFVLVFPPEDEDDKYIILPYFWIPEDNMQTRVARDHVPYDVWERQGYLETTEGNVIHYGLAVDNGGGFWYHMVIN